MTTPNDPTVPSDSTRRLTLEDLAGADFLSDWEPAHSAKLTKMARRILEDTAESLREIGRAASESAKRNVLKRCIERFNQLHKKNPGLIATVERGQILGHFSDLASASGVENQKLAEEWLDF